MVKVNKRSYLRCNIAFATALENTFVLTSVVSDVYQTLCYFFCCYKGASVIECLVNCVIFNNGTHNWIADREMRAEHSIVLKHGEKMIFGKAQEKGLALDYSQGLIPRLIVVSADDERVLVHDATLKDSTLHRMLAMMGAEGDTTLPIALGVIRNVEEESYDIAVNQQINQVRQQSKATTFDQLTATLEQWDI